MSWSYRQSLQFGRKPRSCCPPLVGCKNRARQPDLHCESGNFVSYSGRPPKYDFAAHKGYAVRKKVTVMIHQGLSFLALAVRTVPGRMARDWRAGMWLACAPGFLGVAALKTQAQEQMGNLLPAQTSTNLSSGNFQRIYEPRVEEGFIPYTFQYQLNDQFDKRALQFQVISEFLRNQDVELMRERFGDSARRRIERSVTRTLSRYLESTPLGMTLKDEPWKERLFSIAQDAVTEEMQTLDGQLGEDDPHVDYDVESAVVQRPAWKQK